MAKPEFVPAYTPDGKTETVPATWVDNPGIGGGRFRSAKPSKTPRAKREPVEKAPEAPASGETKTRPAAGAIEKE